MKKKNIITIGVAILIGSAITPGLTVISQAEEISQTEQSNNVADTVNTLTDDVNHELESLAKEYKGVDLSSVNFNLSKMDAKQLSLVDKLLTIEYKKYTMDNPNTNVTEQTFKEEIQKNLMSVEANSTNGFNYRNPGHGLISVGFYAGTVNFLIDAILVVSGFGTVPTLVKELGKEAAEKFIKEKVLNTLKRKLIELCGEDAAKFFGESAAGIIVEGLLNPGQKLAEWIDANDLNPNNGYFEFW